MTKTYLLTIAQLRTSVAYLGERAQHHWWPSAFFDPTGPAFLQPVFSRTAFLAQYHGAQQAAGLVHDEYIGVGSAVFHLFRLPESLEQELHQIAGDPEQAERLKINLISPDRALQTLLDLAGESADAKPETGPVRIGSTDQLTQRTLWQKIARCYYAAFIQGARSYPYIAAA
jgi:hypothetical protein